MPQVNRRTYETIDHRKRSAAERKHGNVVVYEFLRDGLEAILLGRYSFRTMKAAERFIRLKRAANGESVH